MLLSLSSQSDYGLLIMRTLAATEVYMSTTAIAEQSNTPVAYTAQILKALKRAELIESKEGVSGGYRLTRTADTISVKEIIEALEGPIAPVKCLREKDYQCKHEPTCTMKPVWEETTTLVTKQLSAKSLADII